MNLIFFQNCISPHQVPYIKECEHSNLIKKIYLIVPRVDYENRIKMGWNGNNILKDSKIILLLKPNDQNILEILNIPNQNSICLFSGLRADSMIFHWFKLSLRFNVKRFIITEPPFIYNKPLWLHYIRFFIQDYKYIKYINGIFAFGELAVKYYSSISNKWKIFPFQYVTEYIPRTLPVPTGDIKLLYVGSLIHRKNVSSVIKALKDYKNITFNIVGDGEEKNELEKLSYKLNVNSYFYGKQPIEKIPKIMQENDVLILPSLHDGWGAVVNEAMSLGLFVIVSDKCGAKQIVYNKDVGIIYKSNDLLSISSSIKYCIDNISTIRKNVNKNIFQFNKYRSQEVANYFINCILQ